VLFITYKLNKSSFVVLKVYNLLGKEVCTLVEGWQRSGEHKIRWIVKDLPSGMYFYRLQLDDFHDTKKLILAK